MSTKKPLKFMPPDDPTAVYPIGSLRMDDHDHPSSPVTSPINEPERVPSFRPTPTPSGPNPWIAFAAVGIGMLLMGLMVAVFGVMFWLV